jgi:uncharacterized protein YndB with AHSA1/START domain
VRDQHFGTLDYTEGLPSVRFVRVLNAAINDVWAMLTTEEGIQRWLAPARVDLRSGGSIDVDFGEGGTAGGEIIDLVPGVALEYHWRFAGEPDSIVRFELDVIDLKTTRLRLHHRMLPVNQATGYGAGWHAHLDQLEAVATSRDPVEWLDRYQAVLPEYESQTAG